MKQLWIICYPSMLLLCFFDRRQERSIDAGFMDEQITPCFWIVAGLLVGVVLIITIYHFRLHNSIEREKKIKKKKERLERISEIQLNIEREEKAQLKKEQELLEMKQKQLEKEALANALIIEHKNEILKQIQEQIEEGKQGDTRILLKEEKLISADFETIKTQTKELFPDFFNLANDISKRKLTPLDLKYCACIYLNMDTKQISQMLHVETQSVRMFKYRLKQKFGLAKEDNLDSFIRNLAMSTPTEGNPQDSFIRPTSFGH